MEDYLRSKLAEYELRPLGVIHADPAIALAWLTGSVLTGDQAQRETQAIVAELERVVEA